MQIHVNNRLLRRRLWISVAYMAGALACLTAGFLASISSTEPLIQYGASLPLLLVGLALWARNQSYLQRWGPRTRQDEPLARALRGVDARYHLLVAPAPGLPDYLLVGPMGVLVVVPRLVGGTVVCDHDHWRHDEGRSTLQRLLLWFSVRPSLGNPTAEAERGVERTRRVLAARLPGGTIEDLPVEALIVFTHPQVNLVVQSSRFTVLLLRSLRSHVRRLPRTLGPAEIQRVADTLAPAS